MRSRSRKISIRTLALLTAALILLASGGVFTTRAALNIFGDNYDASLALGNIGVQMLENGSEVGDDGALFQNVGDTDKQGNRFFAPGKKYNDTISVQNTGNEPEYVRVIVRKYWTKGNDKQTALSPELIELSTDPDAWVKVSGTDDGLSVETTIYYYKKQLASGDEVTLTDAVRINESVLTQGRRVDLPTSSANVINYVYEFDGLRFNVDAEVQAVQTHDAVNAIKSVWGVDATIDGDGNISSIG